MARILMVLAALGAAVAVAAAVWPAGSQAAPATPTQRTFVSTSGDDANPCSRSEPCRNFAAALPNTLPGGEVVALDSGGYGPFTVDKAVSVIGAPGVHAAVTAFTGNAVTVSAGATDTVVLRNLHLTGLGGENGIDFSAGGVLNVERIHASGFNAEGLRATAAGANLFVADSRFRKNGTAGIAVDGALRIEIERTSSSGNGAAGFLIDGPEGIVRHSAASRNGGDGFSISTTQAITITDSLADRNGGSGVAVTEGWVTVNAAVLSYNLHAGLVMAGGTPVVWIGASTVTGNVSGLQENTGNMLTFGDNFVSGNDFLDVNATLTLFSKR